MPNFCQLVVTFGRSDDDNDIVKKIWFSIDAYVVTQLAQKKSWMVSSRVQGKIANYPHKKTLIHIFLEQDIDEPQLELTNVLVKRRVLNAMPLERAFNSHVINLVICAHYAKYFTSNQGVIIVTKVSVCARIIAKLEKSSVVNVKSIVDISNSIANKLFQMFLRYVRSYFQV